MQVSSIAAYEKDGSRHVCAVYAKSIGGPYTVKLDGEFYSTAENMPDALFEIEDIIDRNGWLYYCPNFA